MKNKTSQVYKGFEIVVLREDCGYSIYITRQYEDIYLEKISNLQIPQNAPTRAKSIKKAQDFIDKLSWQTFMYYPFEIHIATRFENWIFKITKNNIPMIVKSGFVDVDTAIHFAYKQADVEWRKLQTK